MTKECGKIVSQIVRHVTGAAAVSNVLSIMEMYKEVNEFSKSLFKEFDGFCILSHEQCSGRCADDQCWERFSENFLILNWIGQGKKLKKEYIHGKTMKENV